MVTWSMELSESNIRYEPKIVIKAQALADFLAEMVNEEVTKDPSWTLYVDRASSAKGCGARVILEKKEDILVELSITFDFPISNNQAECKALIVGLQLATNVRVTRLTICCDSQIVTSQVTRTYQVKDKLL